MTRKLGRLLVVALVVAAVVAPMTVASADVIEIPTLFCAEIEYDETNPYHIVYPTILDFNVKFFADQWELWAQRHHDSTIVLGDPIAYLNFDMNDVADLLGAPPAGESYVFFWNDMVYDEVMPIPVRIVGTPYDDVICGSPGPDVILGGAGNDYIVGGSYEPEAGYQDDDILLGQAGDDVLIGGRGSDGMNGGGGDDLLFGHWTDEGWYPEPDDDLPPLPYIYDPGMPTTYNDMYGGAGNDQFFASCNNVGDDAYGNGGDDVFYGCDGVDYFFGMAGNDTIVGGGGEDWLKGGSGADEIWGGTEYDYIYGGGGDDLLYANEPDFCGLTPDDGDPETDDEDASGGWIAGDAGDDYICGDGGVDGIRGFGGVDTIDGGYGSDWIAGDDGNDVIDGGPDDDWLYGGGGNDTITGGLGSDWVYGYAGDDTLYTGEDVLPDVDRLMGGPGSDYLYGEGMRNGLFGNYYAYPGPSPDTAADYLFGGPAGSMNYFVGDCDDADWAYANIGSFGELNFVPNYVVTGAIVTFGGGGANECPLP